MRVTGQRELKSACLGLFFQSLPFANPVSNADDVSFDLESVAQILALVKSMGCCYWSSGFQRTEMDTSERDRESLGKRFF